MGTRDHRLHTVVRALFYRLYTLSSAAEDRSCHTKDARFAVLQKRIQGQRFSLCRCQYSAGRYDGGRQHHRRGCSAGAGWRGQHLLDVGRRAARDDDQIYGGLSGGPMAGAPSRFPLLLRRSDVLLCARHPTSHRQAAGGAVLHLLYPLEPVQRQHGPNQRHRPVDAAELFGFPFPVRCGTGAGVRVGAARRL